MATANIPTDLAEGPVALRDEWLARLTGLVASVETWARALDWSTRRIEKKMEDDSPLGEYGAPALLLQREFTRLLLEPIARFAIGTEGTADLCLMPTYDDLANLYFADSCWWIQHHSPLDGGRRPEARRLDEAAFREIVGAMRHHAAELS